MSKILNNQEAMEALLAGKAIRNVKSGEHAFEYIDNPEMFEIRFDSFDEWVIYEPPKGKIVQTMYQYFFKSKNSIYIDATLYPTKYTIGEYLNTYGTIVKIIEHEIEVEE